MILKNDIIIKRKPFVIGSLNRIMCDLSTKVQIPMSNCKI